MGDGADRARELEEAAGFFDGAEPDVEEDALIDEVFGFRLESMADALPFAEHTAFLHAELVRETAAREEHIGKLRAQLNQRQEYFQKKINWRESVLLDWYRRMEFTHAQPLAGGVELTQRKVPEKDRILWPESPVGLPEWAWSEKTTLSIDKRAVAARVTFTDGVAVEVETGEIIADLVLDESKPPVKYAVKYAEVRT